MDSMVSISRMPPRSARQEQTPGDSRASHGAHFAIICSPASLVSSALLDGLDGWPAMSCLSSMHLDHVAAGHSCNSFVKFLPFSGPVDAKTQLLDFFAERACERHLTQRGSLECQLPPVKVVLLLTPPARQLH